MYVKDTLRKSRTRRTTVDISVSHVVRNAQWTVHRVPLKLSFPSKIPSYILYSSISFNLLQIFNVLRKNVSGKRKNIIWAICIKDTILIHQKIWKMNEPSLPIPGTKSLLNDRVAIYWISAVYYYLCLYLHLYFSTEILSFKSYIGW